MLDLDHNDVDFSLDGTETELEVRGKSLCGGCRGTEMFFNSDASERRWAGREVMVVGEDACKCSVGWSSDLSWCGGA